MSISTCPGATIETPARQVWHLLSEPASYALWWDAQTQSILPPGPAQPQQQILAHSEVLGKRWEMQITVEAVDEDRHQLQLTTRLPFGITVHTPITCTPLDTRRCSGGT
jgi:uncharacterized protein YndB with AHSA1/START domain